MSASARELAWLAVFRTDAHVDYESWMERDVLMVLGAEPGVEAVAFQPMWLHWVSETGQTRRYVPDFFVRRAGGTVAVIDVRPITASLLRTHANVTDIADAVCQLICTGTFPYQEEWAQLIGALEATLRLHRHEAGTLPAQVRYLHSAPAA